MVRDFTSSQPLCRRITVFSEHPSLYSKSCFCQGAGHSNNTMISQSPCKQLLRGLFLLAAVMLWWQSLSYIGDLRILEKLRNLVICWGLLQGISRGKGLSQLHVVYNYQSHQHKVCSNPHDDTPHPRSYSCVSCWVSRTLLWFRPSWLCTYSSL